jgi:hypothetical protein
MRSRLDFAAAALLFFAVLRIVSTYTIFSATYDEPVHVSAGLELLGQHRYELQHENPPLPRAVFAIAPMLSGMKYDPATPRWIQVSEVFHQNGRYKTNLVLARVGNLVFFLIAAIATWCWGRRELGDAGGLLTMLLFTMQPVVIGYSGLATHEAPAMAGLAVAVLAYLRWLEAPTNRRAIVFGAAYAFAILCKLSALGYVPAACAAIYLVRALRDPETRRAWRRLLPSFVAAAITCMLLVWAGYAFTVGHMSDLDGYRDVLDRRAIGRFVERHPTWLLPAPTFVLGITQLMRLNHDPWSSYLFGEVRTDGWWYYFPVALALKTTIASLVLAVAAAFARRARVAGEALAAAAAILAVAMPSHLDIGIRFILPMFVPLTVAAAATALLMLRNHRKAVRVAAMALLAWHCAASLIAHPDEFPYFNELAANPSGCLIDSNLDWGQDVLRLRKVVRKKHIERIGLAVLGIHDFDKLGFPPSYEAQRYVPSNGWVAVSETSLRIFGGFDWLRGRPYQRIGKSIRLYYIR